MSRDGKKNSGYINWPTHLTNSGEGGSYVFLIVEESLSDKRDEFVHCFMTSACLCLGDVIEPDYKDEWDELGQIFPLERKFFPNWRNPGIENNTEKALSVPLLAAICLGTSNGSWYYGHYEQIWNCSFDNLTTEGQNLYNVIKHLYNREPTLLTFIDT